ncbi:hypothetical protein JAAARDRAFT_31137 [Jaapia argillacea MUCL 33604]|uniref:Tropomyosin n=1 Tax=Jaapia argillacea MUCL 33604 TaxID=933084 RepID=A0A067QDU2_9AGAM|nr:hypothetical protein JAAARDRAFT_31137 [Jaapia argillacea MUCL 33604]
MEGIKRNMEAMRSQIDERDHAVSETHAQNKKYEQLLLEKDQELSSLKYKCKTKAAELAKTEKALAEKTDKLNEVEAKVGESEHLAEQLEQARDSWEKKFEEAQERWKQSKAELDELVATMEGL